MNKKQMRVAIAKALGHKDVHLRTDMLYPELVSSIGIEPDYPNDLDAIVGAIREMDNGTKIAVVSELEDIVPMIWRGDGWWCSIPYATAAEWCEAFLKAKKLWKD